MNVVIGICPCSFGVWYKDGSPTGIQSKEFLEAGALCGFPVLELGPVGYLPADQFQLAQLMAKYKMRVVSGTVCIPFQQGIETGQYLQLCDLVKSQQGEYVIFMDESDIGPSGQKKQAWSKADWQQIFSGMQAFYDFIQKQGLKPLLHPHVATAIETQQEIESLWQHLDIQLCLDTGHYAFSNGKPGEKDTSVLEFIEKYPEKIAYLHFKNVDYSVLQRFRSEAWDFKEAFEQNVMCDLEHGWIDFYELKKALENINFQGFGILEQDMPNASYEEAVDSVQRNFIYLQQVFE